MVTQRFLPTRRCVSHVRRLGRLRVNCLKVHAGIIYMSVVKFKRTVAALYGVSVRVSRASRLGHAASKAADVVTDNCLRGFLVRLVYRRDW